MITTNIALRAIAHRLNETAAAEWKIDFKKAGIVKTKLSGITGRWLARLAQASSAKEFFAMLVSDSGGPGKDMSLAGKLAKGALDHSAIAGLLPKAKSVLDTYRQYSLGKQDEQITSEEVAELELDWEQAVKSANVELKRIFGGKPLPNAASTTMFLRPFTE